MVITIAILFNEVSRDAIHVFLSLMQQKRLQKNLDGQDWCEVSEVSEVSE
jgi:hypothetical protein